MGLSTSPCSPSRVFQQHFNGLLARGANPTRAAALCLPILSGRNPQEVLTAALRELALSDTSDPPSSGAPQHDMLDDTCNETAAARAGELIKSVLSVDNVTKMDALCREMGDYTCFATMLRNNLGSVDALSRSFILAAAVPDFDLGGSALDKAESNDEMDGRRGEKRARMMSPPVRVASLAADSSDKSSIARPHEAAPASRPEDHSDDDEDVPALCPVLPSRAAPTPSTAPPPAPSHDSDDDMPQLFPVSSLPAGAAASASTPGAASSSSAAAAASSATPDDAMGSTGTPDAVRAPTLRGFGRSVWPGGTATPALAGVSVPQSVGSPLSSPFAGLPRCDVDIDQVFKVFHLLAKISERETRVSIALQDALSAACGQLQGASSRYGERDMGRLRAFVIIAASPLLEDPAFHDSVVARLCKAYGALKKRSQDILSHWFATVGGGESFVGRLDDPLALVLEVSRVRSRGEQGFRWTRGEE